MFDGVVLTPVEARRLSKVTRLADYVTAEKEVALKVQILLKNCNCVPTPAEARSEVTTAREILSAQAQSPEK